MYQPDAVAAYRYIGRDYVVTANEGDARAYGGFNEERRVSQLDLDNATFPNEATLKQNVNLGRLRVTGATGDPDHDNDFDALYSFGARSFSIRDEAGALIWDSGDELEQVTAAAYPTNFNSNNDANSSFKTRSDDKGPEPEGLAVAALNGRTYAFVGLERIGGVAVYDVTDPEFPQFVTYRNHRDFSGSPPGGTALDLGPEGLFVIPAVDSPNGQDLLVTSNEISGTTSIFLIDDPSAGLSDEPVPPARTGTIGLGVLSCSPNPASSGLTVHYSLQHRAEVRVSLHDANGREVVSLPTRQRAEGSHTASLSRDASGTRVPAGIYFLRVAAGDDLAVRKVVLR
jgi:hypothetical protein